MASSSISPIQYLRRIALLPAGGNLTDEHLLDLFIERQDDVAFEMLVRRHGPMVMGVCRRVLGNPEDAEDAFQATFLVLVRKAHAVAPRAMVGNWLYGVAHKAALKARAAASRRRRMEKQVAAFPEPQADTPDDCWSDLRPLLDRELSRLAEKYRAPIVLCDLERKTHKEAARQLGWPEGTLSVRLMRGRKLLAKRLTHSGVSLSAGSLALVFCENSALAAVPTGVLCSTIKATSLLATGQTVVAGTIGVKVAALTRGVHRAMLLSKCKMVAGTVLVMGVLALGGGLATQRTAVGQPAKTDRDGVLAAPLPKKPPQAVADLPKKAAVAPLSDRDKLRGTWKVVARLSGGGGELTAPKTPTKWIIGKESIVMSEGLIGIGKPPSGRQEATYRLWGDNDDAQPAANNINLTLTEVYSSAHGGKDKDVEQEMTFRGIFGWDAEKLVLCFRVPIGLPGGNTQRPTAIPVAPIKDKFLVVLVFEREEIAAAATDEEKLQGIWHLVNMENFDGKKMDTEDLAILKWLQVDCITFDGNTMNSLLDFQGTLIRFKLDPAKRPKEITMRMPGNFFMIKGERREVEIRGIYALDGDDLKTCWAISEGGPAFDSKPPTDFVAKKGQSLLVLKRHKPDPAEGRARIQPKKGFKVGEIVIVGNDKIPSEAILRHIQLAPGEVFDEQSLKDAEKNLATCPLFVVDAQNGIRPTVTVVDRAGDDQFKDILVKVQEK